MEEIPAHVERETERDVVFTDAYSLGGMVDSMGLTHVYHYHLRQIIPHAGIIRTSRDSTPHFYLFDAQELKVMNLGYVLRDFPF